MRKKITAFLAAAALLVSFAGCSSSDNSSSEESSSSSSVSESSVSSADDSESEATEAEETTAEPETEHISPTETISSALGSQVTLSKTISREDGSNTVSVPLSDLIEDGDSVSSFTFIIYSDGGNIGTFKGGCGISVNSDCAAATDEGWYQSEDFSAETEGTYGEITWNVPGDVSGYINAGGEIMFGYWWGSTESIRVEEVICTYTRTKEIACDGTAEINIGESVGYDDDDNTIKFSYADSVPDGYAPTAIIYNISSGGSLGKFTGAFGISSDSSSGWYQSGDVAVFTDSSSLSLTWIIPDSASSQVKIGGEAMLGFWWSNQSTVTLNSVSVKYAWKDGSSSSSKTETTTAKTEDKTTADASSDNGGFRSAEEIVSAIKVGWVLGNSLECYNYSEWTDDAETAWGNPKTTEAMILAVKDAGFNAVRIPVTWGEHMSGNTIDSAWMDRVQEVVDYAYNNDMIVILNMHHDDYTWFTPDESSYAANSEKLCSIWQQISSRFEDYGDRLLFEGMNEPRTVGSSAEWTGGTSAERAVINKYEQDFVDTVRASGGNNAYRTLIVTSYAASIEDAALNDVVIPDDDNIVLSIHYYAPWQFANGESTEWNSADLDAGFSKLRQKSESAGVPVIIGEFGAVANNNDSERAKLFEYYVSAAADNGLKCFVWDNNVTSGEGSYGILNRDNLTWNETLLNGIMNGIA